MNRDIQQFDPDMDALQHAMRQGLKHPVRLLTLQSVGFSTVYQQLYCDLMTWKCDFKADSAMLSERITSNFEFLNAMLDDDGVMNHEFCGTV